MVDDEHVDGSVGGLELKAELTLEGSAEGRGAVADIWIGSPVKGEVVEADEAGLVDDGTRKGRHAGHGGERGGEQAEGNAAAMRAGRAGELTWGRCRMADGAGDWGQARRGGGERDRRLERRGFVVDDEVEAVGEKGLHHEPHLVDGGVFRGAGLDVESIR